MAQTYLEDMSSIWEMVRESFHKKLSRETVELWFGELSVVSFENNVVTLSTPSVFKCNTIREHHLSDIRRSFCEILGFEVQVLVVCSKSSTPSVADLLPSMARDDSPEAYTPKRPDSPWSRRPELDEMNYNFEYTFDNFIIGESNKFAHAACVAVADRPATNFNPLFIYGQSGLGKTHLLHAIINELRRKNPDIRVAYVKGDDFTNQLIDAIKRNATQAFRERYRNCDVLLIDDIQFIAGKVSTQDEFFHTFNSLFEEHKQIILASDRPPRDINPLADRLRNRFEWGLLADIQPPDLELRIAIIKKKAEQVGVELPNDVLMFLAENLRSNIRQMEGSIKKLAAQSFLTGKTIDMDLARSCLAVLLEGEEPVSVTVDKVFAAIMKKYSVSREDIKGQRRTKDVAWGRHMFAYLVRELTDMSFPNIGKIINRDHSTIMTSIKAVERRMSEDNMLSLDISEMIKEIKGEQ